MNILVAGGAGYIGSHTVKELVRSGYDVLVFDNLSGGREEFVGDRPLVRRDLRDKAAVREVFRSNRVDAVLHFASLIQVGESYADPRKYYTHNLLSTLNLLDAMLEAGVRGLIFSSSAAVYGVPLETPITESHPLNPANPYGQTKLMIERILEDYERAYGLRSVSLRYFNAAGADPEGEMGEVHNPETHLIPNILLSLLGSRPKLGVFGNDFPTPDGTAVRDYIHVTDLAEAHVLALKMLMAGGPGDAINLGTNSGYSVLDVIREATRVTGREIPYDVLPRRRGDVAVLLASKEKAEKLLGWKPRLSALRTIIETAWNWHRKNGPPHRPQ
jgi:UDP-glucose 4-epimerase